MIENTVDSTTGMATVRATMPNKDEGLWPGTLVTTRLTLRSEQEFVVPTDAVQVSQSGNFVFVIASNKTAQVRHVETGREVAGETVITRGLKAGETVVTDGQLRLQDGTPVAPRDAKVNDAAAKARAGT
jgi:RND family efflux transporter MFP subunit